MKVVVVTGGSGFIGTNLIDLLVAKGLTIINYDKNKPVKPGHEKYWEQGNIMDEARLDEVLKKYDPDTLVHLAARTDTLSDVLEDYNENHLGTQHILNSVKRYGKIERLIVTSTQYVYKYPESPVPSSGVDFKPYTVYGQSKVLTEQYTHAADPDCIWTIVRPTNIWGPWHMRYPNELWKMIDKGLYYHPVTHPVIRTYGYVKNIAHQIYEMLIADKEKVHKKAFYVGDPSIDSYEWLNQLSLKLRRKKVKRLPTFVFSLIAKGGDVLRLIKIPFPLYTRRFQNMVEDYPAPTEPTVELFGQYQSDLGKNVEETVQWLTTDAKNYFDYWRDRK